MAFDPEGNGVVCRAAAYREAVGIFPNMGSIRRCVGAPPLEHSDDCAIQESYISLESLATMTENSPVRLPAMDGG